MPLTRSGETTSPTAPVLRSPMRLIVACAAVLWISACTSSDDGALPATTTTTAAAPESIQGWTVPRPALASNGTVTVGDQTYGLAVACYDVGAGEVLVLGTGPDPASDDGGRVELYLRAYLGNPYFGLRLSDGSMIESSLDGPMELYVQHDTIRASALRLVTDLDLDTGESTPVGFGAIEITCSDYRSELPN